MARKLYWLPAGLVLAGLILIVYALRSRPITIPPTTPLAQVDASPTTAATPTIDQTATKGSAVIATSQQFFIPTLTPARSVNNSSGTRAPQLTLLPGEIISATATAPLLPTSTEQPLVATPAVTAATVAATGGSSGPKPPAYLARFGVSGSMSAAQNAAAAGLPFGSYLTWGTAANPARPNGAQFWQMVRVGSGGLRLPDWSRLDEIAAAQPGAVWVIGNEPDVIVQDNVTPERYAEIYHELYLYLKGRDPTALVAIAGVSQPTPLRRAYLDRVLNHYLASYGVPMPIDIWTVHAFIFREEAGNWGAGIPPGMNVSQGTLYELSDHADLTIFRQNLLDFRGWLAERGYQETPLAVTEYGVVMPEEYGFPPELVENFLVESFNFFLTANNGTGWSADGGRLFQYWFWYSLHDNFFATPNLYDPDSKGLTPLGARYAAYVHGQ